MVTSDTTFRPPIVDAHHHLWSISARAQPWLNSHEALAPLRRDFGLADFAPLAAAAGVTATVVVQTVTEPGETPELLAFAQADSPVAAVVGWTDLTAAGVTDAVVALRELPGARFLAGIRHPVMTEPDRDWLTKPDVLRGLAAVAAAGLSFDLVVRPGQLAAAARAAAALPQLTFVLDHMGNVDIGREVDEPWARAFATLAELPNVVCKLSGILGVPAPAGSVAPDHLRPYYQLAIDCFGPDRLMFGSDWPVSTLSAPYGQVVATAVALTGSLSPAEQQAVLAGTARRVYGIDAP
jgi:L-fuconolactonase